MSSIETARGRRTASNSFEKASRNKKHKTRKKHTLQQQQQFSLLTAALIKVQYSYRFVNTTALGLLFFSVSFIYICNPLLLAEHIVPKIGLSNNKWPPRWHQSIHVEDVLWHEANAVVGQGQMWFIYHKRENSLEPMNQLSLLTAILWSNLEIKP